LFWLPRTCVTFKGKAFFSEEKNQKTFCLLSRTWQAAPSPKLQKSFASFLQKRRSSFLCVRHRSPVTSLPLAHGKSASPVTAVTAEPAGWP
jgi:hypothetical protein